MNRLATRGRAVAAAGGTVFAIALAAAPVWGAAPFHELERSSSVSEGEACGEVWTVTSTSTTLFMLRSGGPGDPTPALFVREQDVEVYTDPADSSRGFILAGNTLFKDLHVTNLEGTTYRFHTMQSGTSTVTTLDGRVVAKDSGRRTWTFVVDTNGSTNPDDYELISIEPGPVAGPHGIPEDEGPFCDLVAEAIAG